MNAELVQFIAKKLSVRDWEHSGHQEDEDFYLDFAETAIKAYEEHEYMPRSRKHFVEGVQFA